MPAWQAQIGDQRVPVVRRGDADDVNILVLQQLADVGVGFDGLSGGSQFLGFPVDDIAVHVAESDEPDSRHLVEAGYVCPALAVEADHCNSHGVVHARDSCHGTCPEAQECPSGKAGSEESATIQVSHDCTALSAQVCFLRSCAIAPGFKSYQIMLISIFTVSQW